MGVECVTAGADRRGLAAAGRKSATERTSRQLGQYFNIAIETGQIFNIGIEYSILVVNLIENVLNSIQLYAPQDTGAATNSTTLNRHQSYHDTPPITRTIDAGHGWSCASEVSAGAKLPDCCCAALCWSGSPPPVPDMGSREPPAPIAAPEVLVHCFTRASPSTFSSTSSGSRPGRSGGRETC